MRTQTAAAVPRSSPNLSPPWRAARSPAPYTWASSPSAQEKAVVELHACTHACVQNMHGDGPPGGDEDACACSKAVLGMLSAAAREPRTHLHINAQFAPVWICTRARCPPALATPASRWGMPSAACARGEPSERVGLPPANSQRGHHTLVSQGRLFRNELTSSASARLNQACTEALSCHAQPTSTCSPAGDQNDPMRVLMRPQTCGLPTGSLCGTQSFQLENATGKRSHAAGSA